MIFEGMLRENKDIRFENATYAVLGFPLAKYTNYNKNSLKRFARFLKYNYYKLIKYPETIMTAPPGFGIPANVCCSGLNYNVKFFFGGFRIPAFTGKCMTLLKYENFAVKAKISASKDHESMCDLNVFFYTNNKDQHEEHHGIAVFNQVYRSNRRVWFRVYAIKTEFIGFDTHKPVIAVALDGYQEPRIRKPTVWHIDSVNVVRTNIALIGAMLPTEKAWKPIVKIKINHSYIRETNEFDLCGLYGLVNPESEPPFIVNVNTDQTVPINSLTKKTKKEAKAMVEALWKDLTKNAHTAEDFVVSTIKLASSLI